MITCECGNRFYSSREARKLLQVSGPTLSRYREDGWLRGQYDQVGYVFTHDELEFLQQEMLRRDKNIKITTEVSSEDAQ